MRCLWYLTAIPLAVVIAPSTVSAQRFGVSPSHGAQRVMTVLGDISHSLRVTRYQHDTVVNARVGLYAWDCSAMAAWVLARAAPRARRRVPGSRPLAVDFFRTITASPTERFRAGWARLSRVDMALPGDVVAWQRPRWFRSRNTGHVAFVVAPAVRTARGVLLRIADSTSLPHDQDTRERNSDGGFGEGTLLVVTDSAGLGTAYGWVGDRTPNQWLIATPVVVGRVQ